MYKKESKRTVANDCCLFPDSSNRALVDLLYIIDLTMLFSSARDEVLSRNVGLGAASALLSLRHGRKSCAGGEVQFKYS